MASAALTILRQIRAGERPTALVEGEVDLLIHEIERLQEFAWTTARTKNGLLEHWDQDLWYDAYTGEDPTQKAARERKERDATDRRIIFGE